MNLIKSNLLKFPMFKDINLVNKISIVLQINFSLQNDINLIDKVGEVKNILTSKMRKYFPTLEAHPGIVYNTGFPYTTITLESLPSEVLQQLNVNQTTNYLHGFKIDSSQIWMTSNNIYIQDWIEDYYILLDEIFKKINAKKISRIGFVSTYQTSLDNIDNSQIFISDKFKFISSLLNIKISNDYSSLITFETNEAIKQSRFHLDISKNNIMFDLQESKKFIKTLINDKNLILENLISNLYAK